MNYRICIIAFLSILAFKPASAQQNTFPATADLKRYVEEFNADDREEAVINMVPNAQSLEWLSQNIPLFDCPDSAIERIYYFRWWAYRKHIKHTPEGHVVTEFITPANHAGKYNAISSGLGHQINEGRWLRNPQYIKDYINFWFYIDPKHKVQRFHAFSSWIHDAVLDHYKVVYDKAFLTKLVPELDADYGKWEQEKQAPNKMFWQFDVRDAMEESISGSRKEKHIRPTINSYMYGNAKAMVEIAELFKIDSLKSKYQPKADFLKKAVHEKLWDDTASFFKVLYEKGGLCDAREAIGFIPWYFNLPEDKAKYAKQWDQILDTNGFNAPWGLTTAERRHPLFRTHGSGHGCEWDGAVWPYATTQTLKGLSNLLTNYKHKGNMTKQVFYDEFHKYAMSHKMNGKTYIGEYQDEKNGEWLKGDHPRSKFYNHSSFADLIINDLVGLKPRADNTLEINPILPEGQWDWFYLDKVPYHGKLLTIVWDKTGTKYGKGKGFRVFADGKEIAKANKLKKLKGKI
ncbi:MGH1-like glycoside hydrolase domain-containing protein [Desertivirga xinjiangensis]|uniref:MGH1-like glycoside hydrolase domain-containing protein n=1 Tax=Desertivirga xinjiangensis TaxID=539206 RepID=UPI00210B688D|nr:glycosyl hydrolase family 65 protein [Pedobacter xinjiangensis]